MKKVYFIYNPHSGKGTIRSQIVKIINILTESGYEVTVRPTQCQLDAYNTVKRICSDKMPQYDLILCSGGDGTLNETISGLMQSENRLPIGYIPSGTTNDFARSLNIPKGIEKALDTIMYGVCYALDIGSFNDRNFTYVAAFGALTEVSYETPQQTKNVLGHAAYILEGLRHIKNVQSYELTITYDGNTITDEFIFGMISNTAYVGGLLSFGEFSLDDGLYEVTLIKTPNTPMELQSALSSLLNIKQAIDTDYVKFFKTSDIRITCNSEIMWTIDGECGGDQRDVHIYNNRQAVKFMAPKEKVAVTTQNI